MQEYMEKKKGPGDLGAFLGKAGWVHIFTISSSALWLAKTKDFIRVAALEFSEFDVDGLVSLESSVTYSVE